MAEISYPFDSGPGATVGEAEWQRMAREWLRTGVLTGRLNQLAVSADGSGLAVSVASGAAWIEGHYYRSDAAKALTIGTADPTNPRIDTIVARLDRTADTITTAVKAGTPAASPVAPPLTQTDALYELPLADVRVDAAVGVIAAGKVTDRRALTGPFDSAAFVAKTLADAKGDLLAATGPDALARLAVGVDGTVLTADATAPAGVKWAGSASAQVLVRKPASAAIVSSVTLQNDDHLLFPVGANETWLFELVIFAQGHASGDMKVTLAAPAGADLRWGLHAVEQGVSTLTTTTINTAALTSAGATSIIGLNTQAMTSLIFGSVAAGATAGTVQLQWAQNSSNSTASELLAGSYLIARKVA